MTGKLAVRTKLNLTMNEYIKAGDVQVGDHLERGRQVRLLGGGEISIQLHAKRAFWWSWLGVSIH